MLKDLEKTISLKTLWDVLAVIQKETSGSNLEAQQIQVLLYVAQHPDCSITDILEAFGGYYSLSTMSRNVSSLSTDIVTRRTKGGLGLLARYEDPTNRRVKRVRLTPKGERLFQKIYDVFQRNFYGKNGRAE